MFGFGKRKRQIFEYHDGTRTRRADPVAIMRAMASHPTLDLQTHLEQLGSDQLELQNEAGAILVDATRDIFQVRGFSEDNPNGLTELELIDLIVEFAKYTDNLKKNGSGQQT